MYYYLIIISYYLFLQVNGNICPSNLCSKYNKNSECWFNRLLYFNLCINKDLNFPYKLNYESIIKNLKVI
jgi:hypothetical protein